MKKTFSLESVRIARERMIDKVKITDSDFVLIKKTKEEIREAFKRVYNLIKDGKY